jgi:hypothetical protein
MKTPWGKVKETADQVAQDVQELTADAREILDVTGADVRRAAELGMVAFGAVALVAFAALVLATVALSRTSRAGA